uniref:Uncharacterized protein n=1 Tax=Arundo donax TaxID=35708 RepID=A0A0A9A4P3_ARUDO
MEHQGQQYSNLKKPG